MVRYKWHTVGNKPCYACSRWNDMVFMDLAYVPDLPVHPNCECFIEALDVVENHNFLEIGEKIKEAKEKAQQDVDDLEWYVKHPNMLERLVSLASLLLDDVRQVYQTFQIFWDNYQAMKEANTIGGDKYFHSKANAEAAQLGASGEVTAKFISDFREAYEYYSNVHLKKMSLQATIQDREEDQSANRYGREMGKLYPDEFPGDLVEKLRPRGLDEKY